MYGRSSAIGIDPVLVDPEPVSAHDPQPERVVVRRAGQAVTVVMRLDVLHDDVRVPQLRVPAAPSAGDPPAPRRCAS